MTEETKVPVPKHTHSPDEINMLAMILASKAPYDHKHHVNDIDELDHLLHHVKEECADRNHGHTAEGIAGLTDKLNTLADKDHKHNFTELEGFIEFFNMFINRLKPKLSISLDETTLSSDNTLIIKINVNNKNGFCICDSEIKVTSDLETDNVKYSKLKNSATEVGFKLGVKDTLVGKVELMASNNTDVICSSEFTWKRK